MTRNEEPCAPRADRGVTTAEQARARRRTEEEAPHGQVLLHVAEVHRVAELHADGVRREHGGELRADPVVVVARGRADGEAAGDQVDADDAVGAGAGADALVQAGHDGVQAANSTRLSTATIPRLLRITVPHLLAPALYL